CSFTRAACPSSSRTRTRFWLVTEARMSAATDAAAESPEARLAGIGYPVRLPPAAPPRPYEPLVQVGNIVYGSGNASIDRHAGIVHAGQVGSEVDLEEARERARIAMVNALGGLKAHLGELSRVT